MRRAVVFVAPLFYFFGCHQPGSNISDKVSEKVGEENKLKASVLTLHDKLMSRMDEVVSKEKLLDVLKNPRSKVVSNRLHAADENMMTWMHEFSGGEGLKTHDKIMQYFRTEYQKILAINDQTISALAAADSLLANKK